MTDKQIVNLPNKISVGRIVFMLLAIIMASMGDINETSRETVAYWLHFTAYFIALGAGISDLVDGWIARRFNMVTDFGILMDPLADKIFLAVSYILMVEAGLIPALIAIIILCREFMVTGLRTLAAGKGTVLAADRYGKIKSVVQMVVVGIAGAAWVNLFGLTLEHIQIFHAWDIILWSTAALTVWSGAKYFITYRHLYMDDA